MKKLPRYSFQISTRFRNDFSLLYSLITKLFPRRAKMDDCFCEKERKKKTTVAIKPKRNGLIKIQHFFHV